MARLGFVLAGAALAALACAGDWERARAADTPAAYRRFLARSPDSPRAREARERLAYLQLVREPERAGLEGFREEFPSSPLWAELSPLLELLAFEAARDEGSAEAYEAFSARFPAGSLAVRARANAEYLGAGGFAGRPAELAAFAERHPESDYAREALRTLRALRTRSEERFARVGLRVAVETPLPDADRLVRVFSERARAAYAGTGVELRPEAEAAAVDGWLEIRHEEEPAEAWVREGRMEPRGIVARTQVTLRRTGGETPVWSEVFSLRVPEGERAGSGSVLFTPRALSWWSRFFVPVASWPTQAALRPFAHLGPNATAVTADGDRAVAAFGDGSFRELDLSDPAAPRVVTAYERPPALDRFGGVRRFGATVVLYGEDGLEVARLDRQAGEARRILHLDRGRVGAVSAVERDGDALLVAGTRGLLRFAWRSPGEVATVFGGALVGMARQGNDLLLLDSDALYRVPVDSTDVERPEPLARLGRSVAPRALRAGEGLAVVIGARAVVVFDTAGDIARPLARLESEETGRVSDASVVGRRVFLIGGRGLQVLDPSRAQVLDAVDVESRRGLAAAGRHLVAVGAGGVQVVDASPWTLEGPPASAAPAPLSGW